MQSQEIERQSANTGRLRKSLYVILKFTERPKTPGFIFKTSMTCIEGDEILGGDFHAILDKIEVDMLQVKYMRLEMDRLKIRNVLQKDSS